MKTKIVIDTNEFSKWSEEKYNMSCNEWHKIIWRPYMMDYFMNGSGSVHFSKISNPENIFEEHINDFIDDNPEFANGVWMEYTD